MWNCKISVWIYYWPNSHFSTRKWSTKRTITKKSYNKFFFASAWKDQIQTVFEFLLSLDMRKSIKRGLGEIFSIFVFNYSFVKSSRFFFSDFPDPHVVRRFFVSRLGVAHAFFGKRGGDFSFRFLISFFFYSKCQFYLFFNLNYFFLVRNSPHNWVCFVSSLLPLSLTTISF